MRNVGEIKYCSGCTACVGVCPQNIIRMHMNVDGFLYPLIKEEQCTECGVCLGICPVLAEKQTANTPTAYAVYNKDTETRLNSSSGGIFSLLAKQVIADGGVVFGAAFDNEFQVVHCAAECHEDIEKLIGSKYVQSNIGTTFQQVADLLKQGRKVLFSGTPCQIAGLLAQSSGEENNLFTLDIVCHGVPSPKVWKRYLAEHTANRQLATASFRNKDVGWKSFSMKLRFTRGRPYRKELNYDPYLRAFLSNLSLRASCYQCKFKTVSRASDITLADFWGVKRLLPNMDDDRGTSLILVHSAKGEQMLQAITTQIISRQVDVTAALTYNHAACHSVTEPAYRADFFAQLDTMPFSKLVNQLLPITLKKRISILKCSMSRLKNKLARLK